MAPVMLVKSASSVFEMKRNETTKLNELKRIKTTKLQHVSDSALKGPTSICATYTDSRTPATII